MTTTSNNKPVATLTDGALKASIWRNEGKKGAFFTVTFARRYKAGDGNYRDTQSFSGSDLLKLAKLADLAYAETAARREKARMTEAA